MRHRASNLVSPALLALGLCAAQQAGAAPATVGGIAFDTDNATSTAVIVNGGYATPFGTALHSGTSASWTVGTSLGTLFQVPLFQQNYDPSQAVNGTPGTAVSLGQDPKYYTETVQNDADTIQLGWGGSFGVPNVTGVGSVPDLAIFEAATSEAFAVRVYGASSGWRDWRYTPYEDVYDSANDATPTLIDFSDFGLGDMEIVLALQITNLIAEDRVDTDAGANQHFGTVSFGTAGNPASGLVPTRYSSSQAAWVPFESDKFDPDIQYVVGLHNLLDSGTTGPLTAGPMGQPDNPPARDPTPAPLPPTWLLLAPLAAGLMVQRRAGR